MTSSTKNVSTSVTKKAGRSKLDQALAERLIAEASEAGGVAALTGPDGLLSDLVGQILETALSFELDDHLGYDRNGRRPEGQTNARNGTTPKTVHTDVGPVDLDVPRDRDGSFEPVVVPKRSRRLSGFDDRLPGTRATRCSTTNGSKL